MSKTNSAPGVVPPGRSGYLSNPAPIVKRFLSNRPTFFRPPPCPRGPVGGSGFLLYRPRFVKPFVDFFSSTPAAPLPARQGEGLSYPLSPLASRPFRLFFRDRVAAFPARCASRRGRRFLAASRSAVKPSFDRLNVVSWQRSLFDAARRAARAGFSGPAKKRPRSFERGLWRKGTWRRPTFPRMVTQYHRPWRA